MSEFDKEWARVARNILDNGMVQKRPTSRYISDDEPAPTKYVIGERMVFSGKEMPMLFSKNLQVRLTFEELKNILIKKTNVIQDFRDSGIQFWNKWEYPDGPHKGTMGKAYGWQVRNKKVPFPIDDIDFSLMEHGKLTEDDCVLDIDRKSHVMLDQVDHLVQKLKRAREYGIGRNNIITILDPVDVPEMAIFPCVWNSKYYVDDEYYLHIIPDIRSSDMALGNPFNISQYSIWLNLLAKVTGLEVGNMIVNLGDTHFYDRHLDNARKMVEEIESDIYDNKRATIHINDRVKSIYDITWEDITISGYEPGPNYKFELAYTISPKKTGEN